MLERRRIERTRTGDIRLRLPRDERALLRSLPAQLRRLLVEAPDDPSLERLFPPAYDDAEDLPDAPTPTLREALARRLRAARWS